MAKEWMKTVSPESMGVPSRQILAFLQKIDQAGCCMHGFCILRHGRIIAEGYYQPFSMERRHRMYSSSKSITALAVGLLADEGKIHLDDLICEYFRDHQPPKIHPWIQEMTIRDMLCMATPFVTSPYEMIDNEGHDWIRMTYECPPTHRPGQVFSYDTSVAMMLAALVEEKSGMELMDYIRSRLTPLELSADMGCVKVPNGQSSWGGSGVLCTLRDLAKLAQLSLNQGCWEGEQLISRSYMENATSKQIENGREGYGYQFWMTAHGFAMKGMGGQMAYCMPKEDMVFAMTADMQDEPGKIGWVEEQFYTSILPYVQERECVEDPEGEAALRRYCQTLCVRPHRGEVQSPWMDRVSGKTYRMIPNEEGTWSSLHLQEVSLRFEEKKGSLTWDGHTLRFGLGYYEMQDFPGFSSKKDAEGIAPVVYWYPKERPVLHMPCMVSGAWQSERVLELLCYAVGDFLGVLKIRLVFDETGITVRMEKFAEKFWEDLQGFQSGVLKEGSHESS